jgi:phosphatidate cytidylyltransferase
MQRVKDRSALAEEEVAVVKSPPTELTVRIYSALLLIAISLIMTVTSLETFGLLICFFSIAMAWEWGRLVRGNGLDLAFSAHAGALVAACWATVMDCTACAISTVIGGTIAVFLIRIFRDERARAWWSAAGVYYTGLPAVALIWLRSDADFGILAVLYIFTIVWTTDSAAYLFGRWIGGPKLAPRISPKKTWAGFIGGVMSAGLIALLFGYIVGVDSVWIAMLAIVLAMIAQFGDLGESAIKRVFGQKDSSSLIPGHGGVLDRLDGLIFAATAAAILVWILDSANPGRALLLWP